MKEAGQLSGHGAGWEGCANSIALYANEMHVHRASARGLRKHVQELQERLPPSNGTWELWDVEMQT